MVYIEKLMKKISN